jgi:hydroxyacylglutathione hydrolase
MRVVTIPCLSDNYAYLVICEASGEAAVVDPSEAGPVFEAVKREQVRLTAIWNTHHHPDHTGGNQALAADLTGVAVVAHTSDVGRVPAQTVRVLEGDTVALGNTVRARIIHNPGHTSGAISYWIASTPEVPGSVFTGDTLFCAGCGRLFEGTPAEMHASLSKLAALPPETRVYCGHEYTAANLRFAAAAEPDNAAIRERAARVAALGGAPSVPSTIAEERATNPFLRAGIGAVAASASQAEPDTAAAGHETAVFAALRRWKDRFR